jgi:hypothetical protein
MKMIHRSRRWIAGLSCFAVLLGICYVFGTSKGQIRFATGIWLSPLAVFDGSNVATGKSGTHVAVSIPSDSERMKVDGRFTWTRDDEVIFNHKIPWYEDLASSAVMTDVTRRAKTGKGSSGWQAATFSKFGREYHLYYERDTNLLWIVQLTK